MTGAHHYSSAATTVISVRRSSCSTYVNVKTTMVALHCASMCLRYTDCTVCGRWRAFFGVMGPHPMSHAGQPLRVRLALVHQGQPVARIIRWSNPLLSCALCCRLHQIAHTRIYTHVEWRGRHPWRRPSNEAMRIASMSSESFASKTAIPRRQRKSRARFRRSNAISRLLLTGSKEQLNWSKNSNARRVHGVLKESGCKRSRPTRTVL